jgi:glycosyltransferase involved in cell wall biosynthesis
MNGPVATDKVISYAKEADIGLCLIEDLCLSYRFSLPNKLFEYLLAGIPVIVNDLPEQRKFINKYKCGWVLSNPVNDLCDFLKELTLKEIFEKKKGAARVGNEISWEREVKPYLEIVKRCI